MDCEINKQIAGLIRQSNDIAKQVRLENWDSVKIMAQERQIALERFFRKPVNTKYAIQIEKMIRTILDSDNHLIDQINTEKKNTFGQFTTMQKNSKASKTYKAIVSLDCI